MSDATINTTQRNARARIRRRRSGAGNLPAPACVAASPGRAVAPRFQLPIRESHSAIQYLAKRPEVDPARVAIAGYSLGAYLATVVAADSPQIQMVAPAAGGDLPPNIPFAPLVRTIADPLRAVRALNGRPLLMLNGRRDRTVTPSQAQALFDAAHEPKEIHWYDGGHWPPDSTIDLVADWLASHLLEVHARRGSA